MGSGLSHLTNLKPFIDAAIAAGHHVTLAAKELVNIVPVFGRQYNFNLFQSPYLWRNAVRRYPHLQSYAQLVLQRFGSETELLVLVAAWDTIFAAVKPDLVVYDYAPSALVASLGKPWRKLMVGSGFLMPRTDEPYLGVFPGVRNTEENHRQLRDGDARLLQLINAVNAERGLSALATPAELITQCHSQLLLTLPELDHFGSRPGETYLGIPEAIGGAEPLWPAGKGFKVFCYLSSFARMKELMAALHAHGASVLVYGRNIPQSMRECFPEVAFTDTLLNMTKVGRQADLFVTMGNHTTCAHAVMQGVPLLMVPTNQEQLYLVKRVVSAGRGVCLYPDDPNLVDKVAASFRLASDGRLAVDPTKVAGMDGSKLAAIAAEVMAGI